MVKGLLTQIGSSLSLVLAGEIFLILLIKDDDGGYKLRIAEWYRDSALERYQKFIVVSAVSVLGLVFVDYAFTDIFHDPVTRWMESLSPISVMLYDLMVFLVVVGIMTYYTKGKEVDKTLLHLTLGAVLLFLAFGQIEYGILSGYL